MDMPRIARPAGYMVEYSYAGFEYRLTKIGHTWHATPLIGQHPSATLNKHRRAAVECYLQEYNEE
jgi:hypothetical protein